MSESKLGRVLQRKSDRVAAAWRRVQAAEDEGAPRLGLLDGIVEPLVAQIGGCLLGDEGSAWSRTRGVLRVSPERGVQALFEEFGLLRRCLNDAIAALGGTLDERVRVSQALDEAVDSAVGLARRLADPGAPAPAVPFSGVVVELFERRAPQRATLDEPSRAGLH